MNKALSQSVNEMTDIIDIEAIVHSPVVTILKVCAWSLFIIVICFALYWAIKKLWSKLGVVESARVLKAYDVALKDLRDLKNKKLIESSNWTAFYFELDEILRRYIALQFNFDLLDKTYEEIKTLIKTKNGNSEFELLPEKTKNTLKEFWQRTQPIKFAKMPSTASECEDDFKMVIGFVERTKERGTIEQ